MEGRLLAKAREVLAEKQRRNRMEETRRQTEIYAAIPEIRSLNAQIRGVMSELVALSLGQTSRSAEDMEKESLALQGERARLLRQHGYDEHYLDEIISCPLCRDTGFLLSGQPCRCLLKLYKAEQTKELSPLLKNGQESFENFRSSYYPTEPLKAGEPVPRVQMERIFRLCRSYAEDFRPGCGNLLFTGAPGLGKTFLSASIAREVAAKGFSVAYDTAITLLSAFEQEKFSRNEDEQQDAASRVRQLMSCDLLILDDLGTELGSAFTQSALYTLLDGRIRSGRSTIISTNLDRDALRERYGAALASRLEGEYQFLRFIGKDIRALKKTMGA